MNAPGWDAIDGALARIYGSEAPLHYGTVIEHARGGPDPLDGISVYLRRQPRHFHIVTYGFTELYEKENDDDATSGFGFELTFRLARREDEKTPPTWALSFLQNLARYVFETGNGFAAGHHMDLQGPIALEEKTAICGIGIVPDPELSAITTPHGEVAFLQVVGLTGDELAAGQRWRTDGVVALVGRRDALFVTDLARTSVLEDPVVHAEIEAAIAREGSSTGDLFVGDASWRLDEISTATITLGAIGVRQLVALLPARLPFGRHLAIGSEQQRIVFVAAAGADVRFERNEGVLRVSLPGVVTKELAAKVRPERGEYVVADGALRVIVKPSSIRDQSGKVVEVVG